MSYSFKRYIKRLEKIGERDFLAEMGGNPSLTVSLNSRANELLTSMLQRPHSREDLSKFEHIKKNVFGMKRTIEVMKFHKKFYY